MKAYVLCLVTKLCLTLCDPMDCSLSGSCPWGLSRQGYWSGLPCPPPGDLHSPGIEPRSPSLQADSIPSEPPGKPMNTGVYSLCLLPGNLPDPGIELRSPALQADSLPTELSGNMNTCFRATNQNHTEVGPYLHRSLNFLSQTTKNPASPLIPFVSRLVVQLEHPPFSHPCVGSASTNSGSLKVRHGLPGGSEVKNPPAIQEMQKTQARSLGWEDSLEKGMATHSSILAWEIP